MTIQQHYNQWAETYDTVENLTRDLDAQVTQAALVGSSFRSVIEVGCGTGKNTAFLSKQADRLIAVDFSSEMLAQAKSKIIAEHVMFQQADVTRKWPVADQSADLVTCNLILEHIEDLNFIFSEAGRVLTSDGRFWISELHPFRQYQGKKARFVQDGRTTEIDAYTHHISDYFSASQNGSFQIVRLEEHWHEMDSNKLPRLITFLFERRNEEEPESQA